MLSLTQPSLERAPSNPPALGLGFDAWGHSRETRELAGTVGEGATPCTDGRPSENTPPWTRSHQSSLPNAAEGYPTSRPRDLQPRERWILRPDTCRLLPMLGQPLMSGRPSRADHASGAPSSRRLAIPAFAAAAALLSSGI